MCPVGWFCLLSAVSLAVTLNVFLRLVAKMMTADKVWEVSSFPLVFDEWNVIDLSWTSDAGVSLYINDTLQQTDKEGTYQQRVSLSVYLSVPLPHKSLRDGPIGKQTISTRGQIYYLL